MTSWETRTSMPEEYLEPEGIQTGWQVRVDRVLLDSGVEIGRETAVQGRVVATPEWEQLRNNRSNLHNAQSYFNILEDDVPESNGITKVIFPGSSQITIQGSMYTQKTEFFRLQW